MSKKKPPRPTPDIRDMFRLAERYSEASALLEEHSRSDKWAASAPQMLVESFAVELYLQGYRTLHASNVCKTCSI